MAEEKKSLTAVEEAELSKAPLYRLGAKLLKNRLPVSLIATFFTALMAYQALGMQMSTAFNDLLPYRHPFVQVHFKFAQQFGGANNVNIMLKVNKGDVFTKEILKKIYDMTQAMDRVTGVNHFCSEMGLLLALWMAVSFFGSCTFVPAVLVLWKPKFFLRAVEEGIVG